MRLASVVDPLTNRTVSNSFGEPFQSECMSHENGRVAAGFDRKGKRFSRGNGFQGKTQYAYAAEIRYPTAFSASGKALGAPRATAARLGRFIPDGGCLETDVCGHDR